MGRILSQTNQEIKFPKQIFLFEFLEIQLFGFSVYFEQLKFKQGPSTPSKNKIVHWKMTSTLLCSTNVPQRKMIPNSMMSLNLQTNAINSPTLFHFMSYSIGKILHHHYLQKKMEVYKDFQFSFVPFARQQVVMLQNKYILLDNVLHVSEKLISKLRKHYYLGNRFN